MDSQAHKTVGVVGLFDDVNELVTTAEKVRDAGHTRWDCYTPYPVHGLEGAMGLPNSPVSRVSIGAAFLGLLVAIALTVGLHGNYYPINIGGKELFSWQAFVPVYFELFVLFASLATMGAVFYYCGLFRWHSPLHDSGIAKDITCDRFAIVLDAKDNKYDPEKFKALLAGAGCKDIRDLTENMSSEAVV